MINQKFFLLRTITDVSKITMNYSEKKKTKHTSAKHTLFQKIEKYTETS